MIVTVLEIFDALCERKQTCVLTFRIENEPSLMKLYFEGGEVRYITFGARKDAECVALLRECRFAQYTIIDGVTTNAASSGGLRTSEIRDAIGAVDRTVQDIEDPFGRAITAPTADGDALERIGRALADEVGPIASLLLEDSLKRIGCPAAAGARLSKKAARLIVQAAASEVPEGDRPAFLRKCKM